MDPDTEVRERRQALLDAVNARDLEALKSCLAPSFIAVAKYRILFFDTESAMDYQAMLDHAERTFKTARTFREEIEIEKVEIDGDTAVLTTTLIDDAAFLGIRQHSEQHGFETWKKINGRWMFLREERYYSGRRPPETGT
jgi:ketosteroid isomerase-like protein